MPSICPRPSMLWAEASQSNVLGVSCGSEGQKYPKVTLSPSFFFLSLPSLHIFPYPSPLPLFPFLLFPFSFIPSSSVSNLPLSFLYLSSPSLPSSSLLINPFVLPLTWFMLNLPSGVIPPHQEYRVQNIPFTLWNENSNFSSTSTEKAKVLR